ncbi:LCP family protein [Clostridium botulinum]|uniref:Transcriptional regulator n=1 Tax=Clostridium botulinum C/D str. DC5 TaxID=1443128 RepID=A0A0A0IFD4_CLOBO|nr:LCP family protein [Clostridium botulinum]KGM99016.1 transcriptional regulator [Clostridium botulinum C/D str. DC5]KOC55208.1 transcriptional regulator [Clostridium botulinum]KOC58062.1 transcriptional regulator [Clostridium botulinum]MCD3233129.1 LCP family protein [Clostridium botulinum D/C]MCD3238878.1 LCP family protein [Clostridium botulinum D/C]
MKRKIGFKKFFLAAFTILLGIVIISVIYFYQAVGKLNNNSKLSSNDTSNKSSINILALGVDIGTVGSTNKNDPKRTDTMILIHYDKKSKEANAISIPRDTLVKIKGRNSKINAAHATGGVEGAIDAVKKLLDVDIDYYGKINYEGFREVVDAIGGVDVKIENNMNYDDNVQNLNIHFKKGEEVHLDGKKAEEFFRWRKNNDGSGLATGDLGRIDNQHIFISKITEKMKSPFIVFRIPSLLRALPKYIETNMSSNEILKYGYALATAENISTETLKGSTRYIGKGSYFVYNKNQNREILSKLRDVHSVNSDDNSNSVKSKSFKIQILNGTKKQGLASSYKKYIESKGYKNISTGNTKSSNKSRIIIGKGISSKDVENIKDNFDIDTVEKSSKGSNEFDITVILGENQEYKK